jgi:4-hydroxy-2-oxoheptanedioate aldolase
VPQSGRADGLRAVLARRERLVGTFVTTPDLVCVEMLAGAFDLLVLDLEHSAMSTADALRVIMVGQGAGAWILARIPSGTSEVLTHVLDAGVDGIVVPQVNGADEVRLVLSRMSYPPAGGRGYGPRRANDYGRDADYRLTARQRVVCLPQIETAAGAAAVVGIAAVDGVDALLIGPSDLSFELGTRIYSTASDATAAAARAALTTLAPPWPPAVAAAPHPGLTEQAVPRAGTARAGAGECPDGPR